MGIIRKAMSISTLGAVDLRSDKERIARSTRRTHRAIKDQTKYQVELAEAQAQAAALVAAASAAAQRAPALGGPPPGWVTDQQDPSLLRWWDGQQYTGHTKPVST